MLIKFLLSQAVEICMHFLKQLKIDALPQVICFRTHYYRENERAQYLAGFKPSTS